MRFVSRHQEAPGCFAAGRATTGFAIASAASFAALSPVAGFAAFRIPSLLFICLIMDSRFNSRSFFIFRGGCLALVTSPAHSRQDSPRRSRSRENRNLCNYRRQDSPLQSETSCFLLPWPPPLTSCHLLWQDFKNCCATARNFCNRSLRFESCRPLINFRELKK